MGGTFAVIDEKPQVESTRRRWLDVHRNFFFKKKVSARS
jgi:hypothetical protein